ncbi:MAG: O-methyltransferase [Gammaproteobacteria bacterium]|jgi:O-methyltransferase
MASQFGILSKLEFLQGWASKIISGINPAVIHNLEKYYILKKVHYLSAIEDVPGDYLEFGVFTGSSFCHSIRCNQKVGYLNTSGLETRFFGFDSFSGFGNIKEDDKHSFYTDENFDTDFDKVERRVRKIAQDTKFKLVPGFFSDSLSLGPSSFGIEKARIIFVDSDTYSSSHEALVFCENIVQLGTFIVLDDYYSYKGSSSRGVTKAFEEFVDRSSIKVRRVFTYGMGGAVFVVSDVKV